MSSSPVSKAVQVCSESGCSQPAAFRTRSRPSWCDAHITALLRAGGLEPLEPFTKPKAWRLTRCLACGLEAHYRFEYTLEKNTTREATCRACYWRQWAQEVREMQGVYVDLNPVPVAEAREHAEKNGYDYLKALTAPSLRDDPHHVRCRYCSRLSAERMGDLGFGCRCQTNPKRKSTSTAAKNRDLLKDCELPVLDWWDHEVNTVADWETVTVKARREVSWRCPDCGLRFKKRVLDMVGLRECPDCEPKRRALWEADYQRYTVTPVADVPELVAAWADDADPRTVYVVAPGTRYRFRCQQGHGSQQSPHTYLIAGCPSCSDQDSLAERAAVVQIDPSVRRLGAEIASQWHPSKNGTVQVSKVSPGSRKSVWWREPDCGHEWQESPARRETGQRLRCPQCRTILDSLAYHFPDLAAEWSPANPLSVWKVRPSGQTTFVPSWTCSTNTNHVWQASLASRASGSGCPECREHGKSQVELDHHAAAVVAFGSASSGQQVRHEAFVRRSSWVVDITIELDTGQTLVIEYDGSYWHADKADTDLEKSRDLLAAGYLLARLREHPLPSLAINDPAYAEFTVYSSVPTPQATIGVVKQWAQTTSPRCR